MTLSLWQTKLPTETSLPALLRDWREDTMNFLRHDAPKIVLVLIGAYILTKILRTISRKSSELHIRKLPSGVSVQQVRTVASVITSVGVFVIFFVAALEVLSLLGLNLGPMLASAGIAGLAIGFGAQTLVHDFINGFFILLENQYDIGDTVRIAGVKNSQKAFCLHLSAIRDVGGAKTQVRMQWDRGGDEELWQLVLKILATPSSSSDDAASAGLSIPSGQDEK